MRLPIGQSVQLIGTEASQDGKLPFGVFVVDFDHAANEELFLLCCAGFPVVRLRDGDCESLVAGPQLLLRLFLILWDQIYVVFDCGQILHGPRFTNGESAVRILSRLVQFHSSSVPNTYHDDPGLLVRGGRVGRRRRLREGSIFLDAYVGDVGFLDWYESALLAHMDVL
jgi:hypothetical protein